MYAKHNGTYTKLCRKKRVLKEESIVSGMHHNNIHIIAKIRFHQQAGKYELTFATG